MWAQPQNNDQQLLPLTSHFSFAGVVVPGAEFEAARGEDLLMDDDDDDDEEMVRTCLM